MGGGGWGTAEPRPRPTSRALRKHPVGGACVAGGRETARGNAGLTHGPDGTPRHRRAGVSGTNPPPPLQAPRPASPTLRHKERDTEAALQHPLPQRRQVGSVEGERPAHQHVQHDAEALQRPHGLGSAPARPRPGPWRLTRAAHAGSYPDVQLGAFVLLPLKDFWGRVRGAPTPRGQGLS